MTSGPLARFLEPRPATAAGERCELCGEGVPARHRHLVDLRRRSLVCSCRACTLLFDRPAAAGGRYGVVPERYARLEPFRVTPWQWNALQIPVGLAFFLRTSRSEGPSTVAFYPSPAGATESELVLDVWEDVVAANPALAGVAVDTEAALVRFSVARPECYVVPVDRCYELVGRLRAGWRGFDGGHEVREQVEAFFGEVRERSGGRA